MICSNIKTYHMDGHTADTNFHVNSLNTKIRIDHVT